MEVSTVKGLAGFCIFLASLLGGLLPFWLKRRAAAQAEQADAPPHPHQHEHTHQSHEPQHEYAHADGASIQSGGAPSVRVSAASLDEEAGYGLVGHSHSGGGHPHSHSHEEEHHSHQHSCCHLDVDRCLSFGNMLGAGIFLGGGLMHLLPESVSGLAELKAGWWLSEYPLAYFLAGLGFFVILTVEEATIAITRAQQNKQTAAAASAAADQASTTPSPSVLAPILRLPTVKANASRPKISLREHFRNLSRNLVQGLTPRVALVPDSSHTHVRALNCGQEVVEECSMRLNAEPEGVCINGPIQAFLDAPDTSPDPFPSLAERGRREHALQHHHRCPGQELTRSTSDSESLSCSTTTIITNGAVVRRSEETLNVCLAPPLPWSADSDQPPPLIPAQADERSYLLGVPKGESYQQASGHGHAHGHGDHSHVEITSDTSYIVAYLLVLALSFHNIFEGIALGTQERMTTTLSLFVAILAHSPLAGFALGVSLVKSRAAPRMALSCLFLFAVTTPIGTVLGLMLSVGLQGSTLTIVSCCFQAFSAGTFFFVAFEEIIPKELALPKDKPLKLALCVLGFLAMAAIKTFDP